jgi:hypothetical protein
MLFRYAALATFCLGAVAYAQDQTPVAIPPAPPIVAAPAAPVAPAAPTAPVAPPPGLVETPVPPASSSAAPATQAAPDTAAPASPDASTTPAAPDVAPVPANSWVPGNTATLGVLDKVDGSATQVSIAVGAQANIGDLQVSVQSCVNRPAGQLPDAAVFLSVQNPSTSDSPLYRGWMVRSTPAATVVGDASETFRVIGCS